MNEEYISVKERKAHLSWTQVWGLIFIINLALSTYSKVLSQF